MIIRKTVKEDLKDVMQIINMARSYFKSQNINQWQGPYPCEEDIIKDIDDGISYVVVDDKIVAVFVLSFEKDSNYDVLIEGKWLNDNKYGVLHRIAVNDEYKGSGIGSFIISESIKMAQENNVYDIRIDTHDDNESMKKLICKNNFVYCGLTRVNDGNLRNVYHIHFKDKVC